MHVTGYLRGPRYLSDPCAASEEEEDMRRRIHAHRYISRDRSTDPLAGR